MKTITKQERDKLIEAQGLALKDQDYWEAERIERILDNCKLEEEL